MANLTQTAANVKIGGANTVITKVQYGENITQGQPLYKKSSDGKYYKADANVSAEAASASGIAMTPGATDGYGVMASSGLVDLGATLTLGETYYVSDTAGAIMPAADVSTGEYVTQLGIATTTALLQLTILASGVQRA